MESAKQAGSQAIPDNEGLPALEKAIADCLTNLGRTEEAREHYTAILDIIQRAKDQAVLQKIKKEIELALQNLK